MFLVRETNGKSLEELSSENDEEQGIQVEQFERRQSTQRAAPIDS